MYCKYCGAETSDYNRFCPRCGKPIGDNGTYVEQKGMPTEFDRKAFKRQAKNVLSKSYWYAFLVCLINTIILGGLSFGNNMGNDSMPHSHMNISYLFAVGMIFLMIFTVGFAFGVVYLCFFANPFSVGKTKFFLDNRSGNCELGHIVFAFKDGHYINIVKGMAWRYLFQFLWTLLFVIPGIVKYYAYILVPYILADNPELGYDRALKLSMDMTRGYKGNIFVLQLSFLGWYLLGAICLGIGVLFVNPYFEASLAEMYVTLRSRAVDSGFCTRQELNLA